MCYNYKWDAVLKHPSHWIATVLGVTIMHDDTSCFDSIQIPLTKGYTAIVSPEDADLAEINWYAYEEKRRHVVYAQRGIRNAQGVRTSEKLHRVILGRILGYTLDPSEVCDHVNHDGLDNRRSNLRVATQPQNSCNRALSRSSNSGYKGVTWRPDQMKWRARIQVGKKPIPLGQFINLRDAVIAYNEAAIKYHGEFASLNPIPE